MREPVRHFYEFGPFRLDAGERILLRDGHLVSLTPKTFETLLALVESGGRIVDKEELLKRIWPDTFVEEVSLAKKVSLLRKTLGEGLEHHYIETIPRRGYRFVADVREVRQENGSHSSDYNEPGHGPNLGTQGQLGVAVSLAKAETPSPAARPSGQSKQASLAGRVAWPLVFLVIGLMAGLIFWRAAFSPVNKAAGPLLRVVPLTSFQGHETQVAFSPDGNQIAFVWDGPQGDNTDIYVKLIDSETPLRLTTDTAADTRPAWSPDGRYIAFLRQSAGSSAYYLIPALGGAERKLAEVFPYHFPSPGNSPYYSPDGKYLAVQDKNSPAEPLGIFLLSVEAGEKRKLTAPPAGDMGDHYPAFSPNGRMLAFVRAAGSAAHDLYVMPLPGGEPKRLTFDSLLIPGLAWTVDSREIVFGARQAGGTTQLWRIAASGGTPERIDAAGKDLASPAVSPQGNRLAYTQTLGDINIWRIELNPTGQDKAQTELIASTFADHGPDYSPDGQKIVFASDRTGGDGIWISESDGAKPRLLINRGADITGTPRWSPDGRWVVFDSRSNGSGTARNPDIYVISAEGGQPRPLTTDPAEDVAPSWSRDGRSVYFGSTRSGSMQIWRVPVAGGPPVQVTRQGGFEAFESADGKHLFYSKGRAVPGLWRMPVEGGEEAAVLDHHQAGLWRYWRVADHGIYFATAAPAPLLEFFSFATGQVSEVVRPARGPERNIPGLAVSPDGRYLLYTRMDHSGSDIMMAEGFR